MLVLASTASPGNIVYVQSKYAVMLTSGQSSVTVTLPSTVAGNFFVIMGGGVSGPTGITVTASNGSTCVHATGAFKRNGAATLVSDIWYVLSNAAPGSVIFTLTPNTGTLDYPQIVAAEFSGVAASGADAAIANTLETSANTFNISTSSAVPQTNDLVVSMNVNTTINPASFGASQILLDPANAPNNCFYQITTSGVVTHTCNFSGANNAVCSIAAFKHP